MQYFEPILIGNLTKADIDWLAKAGGVMYDGRDSEDFFNDWLDGKCAFWRIIGGPSGVMVTVKQREVFLIDFIVGVGLIRAARHMRKDVLALMRAAGCRMVDCVTNNPALARVYTNLGCEPVGLIMRL